MKTIEDILTIRELEDQLSKSVNCKYSSDLKNRMAEIYFDDDSDHSFEWLLLARVAMCLDKMESHYNRRMEALEKEIDRCRRRLEAANIPWVKMED